jgi:hypothetical protein
MMHRSLVGARPWRRQRRYGEGDGSDEVVTLSLEYGLLWTGVEMMSEGTADCLCRCTNKEAATISETE